LQERFPEAVYEDVIGLCKLAILEEIQEQDYSLNPGRYVGVVIEEDGMTEEEFESEVTMLNQKLFELHTSSNSQHELISKNLTFLFDE
jgi:type I restriction enzyme M protein